MNLYGIEYNPYEMDYSTYGTEPGGHLFFRKETLPDEEQPEYRYDEWSGEAPSMETELPENSTGAGDLAMLGALGLIGWNMLDDSGSSSTGSGIMSEIKDFGGSIADSVSSTGIFNPQSIAAPDYSIAGLTGGQVPNQIGYTPAAIYDGGDFVSNMKATSLATPALYGLGGAAAGYASGGGKQVLRSGLGAGIGSWLGSGVTGGSTAGSAIGALAGMALAGGDDNPIEKAWDEIKSWF